MAYKIILEKDGSTTKAYVGFSWTVFLFGIYGLLWKRKWVDVCYLFLAMFIGYNILFAHIPFLISKQLSFYLYYYSPEYDILPQIIFKILFALLLLSPILFYAFIIISIPVAALYMPNFTPSLVITIFINWYYRQGLLVASSILLGFTYENEQTRLLLEQGYKPHDKDRKKIQELLIKHNILLPEEKKIQKVSKSKCIYYTKDNIMRIINLLYLPLQMLFVFPIYPLFYGNTKYTFLLVFFQLLFTALITLIYPRYYTNTILFYLAYICIVISTYYAHIYLYKKYILQDKYTRLS